MLVLLSGLSTAQRALAPPRRAQPSAQVEVPELPDVRREAYRIVRARALGQALDPLLESLVGRQPSAGAEPLRNDPATAASGEPETAERAAELDLGIGPAPSGPTGASGAEDIENNAEGLPAGSGTDQAPEATGQIDVADVGDPGLTPVVPGIVVVAMRDGDIVYERGLQAPGFESAEPLSADTVFPVGELGESFASLAVAGLVEEGVLRWNEPASKHLPAWQPGTYQNHDPSFTELLTHSAGYATSEILWRGNAQRSEVVRTASRALAVRRPGSTYAPFRVGALAATMAASQAAGEGWGPLLARRVFDPLGMQRSFVGSPGRRKVHAAPLYRHAAGEPQFLPIVRVVPATLSPTMGVRASASDLLQWARFLLGDGEVDGQRVLRPGSFEALFSVRTGDRQVGRSLVGDVELRRSRKVLRQFGATSGSCISIHIDPDLDAAWIALASVGSSPAVLAAMEKIDAALAPELLDERPQRANRKSPQQPQGAGGEAAPTNDEQAPETPLLETFLGGLGEPLPGPIQLAAVGGQMFLLPAGREPVILGRPLPNGHLPFGNPQPGAAPSRVELVRNESGELDAIVLHVSGFAFRLPRRGSQSTEPAPPFPEELLGVYQHPERGPVVLELVGDQATMSSPGGLALTLDGPDDAGHRALLARPEFSVSFERTEDGTPAALIQHLSGLDLRFDRIEGEAALEAIAKHREQAPETREPEPATAPPLAELESAPKPEPAPEDESAPQVPDTPPAAPTPNPVIEAFAADPLGFLDELRDNPRRYEAIESVGPVRLIGRFSVPTAGIFGTSTLTMHGMQRFRWDIDLGAFGRWGIALDGERATERPWFAAPRLLEGPDADLVALRHPGVFIADWSAVGGEVSFAGPEGPDAVRLTLTRGDAPTLLLTVGATGDVRAVRVARGDIPALRLAQPKVLGGISIPFQWTLEGPPLGVALLQWTSLEAGVEVGEGWFDLTHAGSLVAPTGAGGPADSNEPPAAPTPEIDVLADPEKPSGQAAEAQDAPTESTGPKGPKASEGGEPPSEPPAERPGGTEAPEKPPR